MLYRVVLLVLNWMFSSRLVDLLELGLWIDMFGGLLCGRGKLCGVLLIVLFRSRRATCQRCPCV